MQQFLNFKELFSIEAEQAVLGTLLSSNETIDRIESIVSTNDFYRQDHRTIFATLLEIVKAGKTYDIITITENLRTKKLLQEVGGQEYIGHLAHNYYSYQNIEAYAEIVRDNSILRQIHGFANEAIHQCHNTEGIKSQEILDNLEKKFTAITLNQEKGQDTIVSVKEALSDTLSLIERLAQSEGGITGYATKWDAFNEKTLGFHKGEMTVVAGRPSMGKSAFAVNVVEGITTSTGLPCAIFSLEMPKEDLMLRLYSSVGSIDLTHLRSGKLDSLDLKKLQDATKRISKMPLFIDDRGLISVSEIRSTARKLMRTNGQLGAIMVDYLQLIHTLGKQSELRAIEVAEISRSLKLLARELNVPVVVLSQLNRGLEQRSNKRPIMSDIRESGAIEQDADNIIFIYRDEVYNSESLDKGIAEIIIGKQRNGPLGTVKLAFQGKYSRFVSLASNVYEMYQS